MGQTGLTDLDELIQKVKEEASRSYIIEAINAYQTGAYRAAILCIWTAVAYDIIIKIRQLADREEDENAIDFVNKLSEAIRNAHTESPSKKAFTELQNIERDLLANAQKIGLLTQKVCQDFKLLKEERNLCAHPAFVIRDPYQEIFELHEASPESVRVHLFNAVNNLLRYDAQHIGERLQVTLKAVIRKSSIKNPQRIIETLNWYLQHTTPHQVKKSIDFLIQQILKPDDKDLLKNHKYVAHFLTAFKKTRFHGIYEHKMKTTFPEKAQCLTGKEFNHVFLIIGVDLKSWKFLKLPTKNSICTYLEQIGKKVESQPLYGERKDCNSEVFIEYSFFKAIDIPELRPQLMKIFNKLQTHEKIDIMLDTPHADFTDEVIDMFIYIDDPNEEARLEKIVLHLINNLSTTQIIEILEDGVCRNKFIADSLDLPDFLLGLLEGTIEQLSDNSVRNAWKLAMKRLEEDYQAEEVEDNSFFYAKLRKKLRDCGIKSEEEYEPV